MTTCPSGILGEVQEGKNGLNSHRAFPNGVTVLSPFGDGLDFRSLEAYRGKRLFRGFPYIWAPLKMC